MMSHRRTVRAFALSTIAVAVVAVSASPGLAAAGGGACQLHGVANLTPGLSTSASPFAYNFTGDLTNCQSNVAGAPTSGTVSSGVTLPATVTLTNTATGATSTGTVRYQEPISQGTGSCGNSTTSGQALTTW